MNYFNKPKSINSSIDINEVINNISPYLNKEYIIDTSPDVEVPFDNVRKYFDKWIYNEFNEPNMIKSLVSFLNNLNVVNSDILNYIEQKLNITDVYSVDVYNSLNYGDFLRLVIIQYEKTHNNDSYYMFIILDNKIIINDTINESFNFIKPKSINSVIDYNIIIDKIKPYLNKFYVYEYSDYKISNQHILDENKNIRQNILKYFDKPGSLLVDDDFKFINDKVIYDKIFNFIDYLKKYYPDFDLKSVYVYNSEKFGKKIRLLIYIFAASSRKIAKRKYNGEFSKCYYDIVIDKNINESFNQLNEGGLAKHMNHPYEVNEFTFNDLKKIITKLLDGKFDNVTEKMDGLNIFVSYDKNGNILAARNNKQISDPLTLNTIKEYFKSSIIGNTYYNALLTIDNEFKQKFNNLNLNKIFDNGKRWINTEIISTDTKNVIPYENNLIVFHNIKTYKGDNEFENYDNELLYKLVKLLNNNSNFKIITSPILNINKLDDKFKNNIINELDLIKNKYKLKDNSTILEFKYNALLNEILNDNILSKLNNSTIKSLINRWINGTDKNNNINAILKYENLSNEDLLYVKNFDKNIGNIIKIIMKPFDNIFIKVGNEVINNISNISNNRYKDKVIKYLNNKLSDVSDEISKSNDQDKLNKFYYELERLSNVSNKLNATEGIVLSYKGHDLKITGSFAPLNKILGMEHGRFER